MTAAHLLFFAGVNYKEGPWFVQTTLSRDQDITLDFAALRDVLNRIWRLHCAAAAAAGDSSRDGRLEELSARLQAANPGYFVVDS
jgi:hypothetical protein